MVFHFHQTAIAQAAQWILQQAEGRSVIALYAPMGAGKTTLTGAIMHALGSTDHAASPTFSIINEYLLPRGETFYHMDWYRLKNEDEAIEAGVEDALYSGHRCIVEWPEKAPTLLPPDTLAISISITGPETRMLKIEEEQ